MAKERGDFLNTTDEDDYELYLTFNALRHGYLNETDRSMLDTIQARLDTGKTVTLKQYANLLTMCEFRSVDLPDIELDGMGLSSGYESPEVIARRAEIRKTVEAECGTPEAGGFDRKFDPELVARNLGMASHAEEQAKADAEAKAKRSAELDELVDEMVRLEDALLRVKARYIKGLQDISVSKKEWASHFGDLAYFYDQLADNNKAIFERMTA